MYDGIQNLAYELRLLGLRNALERRCHEALAESYHPAELIRLLLEDERQARQAAAAKRLVSRAKFRSKCALEDWDISFDRGFSKARFKELAVVNFYHKLENLIITGKTGVGKTHLAIALGHRICNEGAGTLFFSANLFFEEIQAERVAGRYLQLIRRLAKTKALILDDFGLRTYTHAEATALLEVLEERYAKGITIITSQISPPGWAKLFEDPVVAEAVIDRLCNPALTLELKGDSYRKKKFANAIR